LIAIAATCFFDEFRDNAAGEYGIHEIANKRPCTLDWLFFQQRDALCGQLVGPVLQILHAHGDVVQATQATIEFRQLTAGRNDQL
jgi:hypothetical protein